MDTYFQTTNFDTIKNINGARNKSDFVLTLPLRLTDINLIYELELHPRCVSFGKKLTLMICRYQPRHRRELKDMVQNVISLWRHFEHLEVQEAPYMYDPNRPFSNDNDEPPVIVPYGQLGSAEYVKMIKTIEHKQKAKDNQPYFGWYQKFRPDHFDMYVPFLQHLTNLKTVTLLLRDRHKISQILLRIPRISKLERILIGSNLKNMHVSWHTLTSTVYRKCCHKLSFLAGCEIQSLEKFVKSVRNKDATNKKFDELTELHVTISRRQDLDAMMRVTRQKEVKLGDFFPKLTILQVKVASDHVYGNVMNMVNEFTLQFPTLEHFSLGGHCVPPECLNLDQVYGRKTIRLNPVHANASATTVIITSSNSSTIIETIQFECPSHVPWKLMQCFPLLKHVIIAEQPGRCKRRVSKSNDRAYIRAFFKLCESTVRTVTFVPSSYLQLFQVLLFEPGAITHRRTDRRWQGRKRKRDD